MNAGGWRRVPLRSRRRNSFLFYALGSIGTFAMAARVVQWLDGPQWLGLAFIGVGLTLGLYYLGRALLRWRTKRGAVRR
ncbi:hypothetical protein QFZ79_002748 [Arthrobacter sp. V4I6]|uniref:hypothetical protein n=1 Tax=unclassified Arthrobacter TaxID=235627 RepID=UPI002783E7D8|nr:MULTISPECIES: hypothetical protein [unclassified Arthrobacter]MDQ0820456.1 hypothetical protein [Arthrobacter sp. V1I7]MDQ0854637.1 hypothetical protein [Arthrobacter sp. V4I6]